MSDEATLLPCPFCGGEAEIVEGMYSSFQEGYAVRCRHCALTLGASGRLGECYEWSCSFTTEAEAIAAWNSRAERTCKWELEHSGTLYDKWRCSKCGYLFVEPRCDQGYTGLEPNYCPSCGRKVVDE